ncbi:MAG: precorrin-8X methylmutase [Spirulina sp. SIO3F2]|nr:precorrin-8X methylmutase [Spirulina sp. SIO3F2]
MDGSSLDIQGLKVVDREISKHTFTPAEYAIVRRVIGETGDFEYQSLVAFSAGALQTGAEALATRQPVITDLPMVQLAVQPMVQATFLNALHCASQILAPDALATPSTIVGGLTRLAKAYPNGIFVMGQAIAALTTLVELIEAEEIHPALVIATPAGLVDADVVKDRLQDSRIPNICVRGRKGGPTLAFTIFNELTRLAWVAHHARQNPT